MVSFARKHNLVPLGLHLPYRELIHSEFRNIQDIMKRDGATAKTGIVELSPSFTQRSVTASRVLKIYLFVAHVVRGCRISKNQVIHHREYLAMFER